VAGPLGCFVVWRRIAFFGDTLAHSALLGVAIGLALDIHVMFGVLAAAFVVAVLLNAGQSRLDLGGDIVLGLAAPSLLALGLVAASFLQVRFDLMAYLFGDILAVSQADLIWIWTASLTVLGLLVWLWPPLLAASVHEELARVEGVPVANAQLGFILLLAFTVAIAMKVVGVLLLTALLIVPAVAARPLARSPESMAIFAAIIGAISIGLGLAASMQWDTPAGPSIVLAAAAICLISLAWPKGWFGQRI
jgi:zinc transport system permease protein